MRAIKIHFIFVVAILLAIGNGCRKKEENRVPLAPTAQAKKQPKTQTPAPGNSVEQTPPANNMEDQVTVPASVKGIWNAVTIEALNKQTNQKINLVIPIRGEAPIPNSSLTIKAENFLPDFRMEGTNITSVSNEPNNPAAQIIVMENGKEIFKGWFFARFPSTQFEHPNYTLTLAGYAPQS